MQSPRLKNYRQKEKIISATLVGMALVVPFLMTICLQRQAHWMYSGVLALTMLATSIVLLNYRGRLEKKIKTELENLEVGHVLARKHKKTHRFVITNTGYNHYYLKSLESGEQLLVSRRRAFEDFDIAL